MLGNTGYAPHLVVGALAKKAADSIWAREGDQYWFETEKRGSKGVMETETQALKCHETRRLTGDAIYTVCLLCEDAILHGFLRVQSSLSVLLCLISFTRVLMRRASPLLIK